MRIIREEASLDWRSSNVKVFNINQTDKKNRKKYFPLLISKHAFARRIVVTAVAWYSDIRPQLDSFG